ncbi:MAG: methylmalonyl Co-A mutase-associated GTPase MeaB [Alphaproteobacteria bacterium]|nr:methylmalonyl Co-A mutase-associated GTPase MeaB [Alphaproteobacteria bacterium]MDP6872808.1 methylmalonyl Co-A mutase-associated GTPase MeaB [Alphaproteobacteria bacterium]
MTAVPNNSNSLLERLLSGQAIALAKSITAVENDTAQAAELLTGIQPHLGRALVVGFTGPPGAGKSTLVNALIVELRRREQSVGVVAVDPSSPLTGGAILGDRIRMSEHTRDPGVFVRSLAARGHLGGLSPMAARVIDVMDASGRDVVVVETVGAGQSEVEIAEIADVRVVISAPGLGDDVQAIKAGILEIADILVVNKADLPLAERTVSQLKSMLSLREGEMAEVPVLSTTATTGEGIVALADAVEERKGVAVTAEDRAARALQRVRRLLADATAQRVRQLIRAVDGANVDDLCAQVQRGELGVDDAAARLLRQLQQPEDRDGA